MTSKTTLPTPTRPARTASMPRSLIVRELQHHARNGRFTPGQPVGMTPEQIASATGLELAQTRIAIRNMRADHLIINAGTTRRPLWRLTVAADKSAPPKTYPQRHVGTYCGAELRPYTGRTGAMDAFALPSVANGVRHPAKRPTAQCVGMLANRTNNARG